MEPMMRVVEQLRSRDITPNELAENLGVSTKTLRKYVNQANEALGTVAHIDLKRNHGYHLDVADVQELEQMLAQPEVAAIGIPQTPEERVSFLLGELLYRTDWITIDEIAEVLYASRNTVTRCLKDVEAHLAQYDLVLERRPRYGIRVVGEESERRLCLAELVLNDIVSTGAASVFGDDADDENIVFRVKGALRDVQECVLAAFDEQGSSDLPGISTFQNLLIHVAVAVLRIRSNCYMPMDTETLAATQDLHSYELAQAIARRVEERFSIELPEDEVAYIAIHLATRQHPTEDGAFVISDEVWAVVSAMLERVWEAYRFDFRHDVELRMNLARHIVPLSMRLKFHLKQKNPLLHDIKTRFPLAYSIALDASVVLQDAYDAELSEEEAGYIALAFALALERSKSQAPHRRILIVCASGAGTARLLEYRYRKEFNLSADEVTTCDVTRAARMDYSKIDYVFTTVPLGFDPPVPVRLVGNFLDEGDIQTVRSALAGAARPSVTGSLFDERYFFPHLACTSREEVLDILIGALEDGGSVPESFRELVWERERAAETCFGNRVALPHPARVVAETSCVAVGILDAPIPWGEREVQVVFLVCIAKSQSSKLADFYRDLSAIVMDTNAVDELVAHQEFPELLRLIEGASAADDDPWDAW